MPRFFQDVYKRQFNTLIALYSAVPFGRKANFIPISGKFVILLLLIVTCSASISVAEHDTAAVESLKIAEGELIGTKPFRPSQVFSTPL